MSDPSRALRLAIIAGEASGDALGVSLVRALRSRGVDLSLSGVGGAALEREGLASFFPQSDIAVMGVAAVVQRLPLILRRINETAKRIVADKPDILLTIDSPDFCLRVTRKVRAAAPGVPIAHWVCPSVWAWRPGRARRMAPHVDRVFCLLPFEPAALTQLRGPRGVYVGHPLIERIPELRPQSDAERAARADADAPEILLLPGSRRSEASRLMTGFREAAVLLSREFPRARFVLPAVEHLRSSIESEVRAWPVPVGVVAGEQAKLAAFRRARAALAASGTVTLELALAGVPTAAVYRVAEWEAVIARRLLRVSSVLLPNLVLGRNVMPELLQGDFTPAACLGALAPLIAETPARRAQLDAFDEIAARMRGDGASPSAHVADQIMDMLAQTKTPR
ncbi:MAG: lipid-A-disaccharide synthase [Rhizobiales bacterium 65-9]|nr:lipid-A-disaccharide synthase [Hyphomicrobiales bacterium]OJY35379.1 MAG: lipid-A-disaccharide synthase [Rhizobiales bacterium 65-9]